MRSAVLQQHDLTQKAEALHRRIDEFEIRAACAAIRQVPLYASEAPVPFDVIVSASAANMRAMFSAIAAKSEFDPTPGTKVGIERARDGVPLASVMEAYRVGFHALWDEVVDVPAIRAPGNEGALRALTTRILEAQDIYTDAMVLGYRNEQSRRLLSGDYERRVLMDSLLGGRLFGQHSLWEAVQRLRLPSGGPFVVVAGGPRSRHRSIADDRVEAAQRRSMPPRFWGMSSLHVVRNRPFLYAPGVVPRVRHSVS